MRSPDNVGAFLFGRFSGNRFGSGEDSVSDNISPEGYQTIGVFPIEVR